MATRQAITKAQATGYRSGSRGGEGRDIGSVPERVPSKRFSGFLNQCQPPVRHPTEMDRALLERYLAWLAPLPLADSTKVVSRVFLPVHRQQAQLTRELLDAAQSAGRHRQAENHRTVPINWMCAPAVSVVPSRRAFPQVTGRAFSCGPVATCRPRQSHSATGDPGGPLQDKRDFDGDIARKPTGAGWPRSPARSAAPG